MENSMKKYILIMLLIGRSCLSTNVPVACNISLPLSTLLFIGTKPTTSANNTSLPIANGAYGSFNENFCIQLQKPFYAPLYPTINMANFPYANPYYYFSDIINSSRTSLAIGESYTKNIQSVEQTPYFKDSSAQAPLQYGYPRNIRFRGEKDTPFYAVIAMNSKSSYPLESPCACLQTSSLPSKMNVQTIQFFDTNNNALTSSSKDMTYFAGMVPNAQSYGTTSLYWPLHLVSPQDNPYTADGPRVNFGPNNQTEPYLDTNPQTGASLSKNYYYTEAGTKINFTWRPWTQSYFPRAFPLHFTIQSTSTAAASAPKNPLDVLLASPHF